MSEFFLELFSEEIPANLQKNARNVLLQNFKDFFIKKNIKNFSINISHGATEVECKNNISSLIVDVVQSGKTLRSNSLKTLTDSKIMDTSACLFANKKALKNKNVLKVLNILTK